MVSRDVGYVTFSKKVLGFHAGTSHWSMHAKFEVRIFNLIGAIST